MIKGYRTTEFWVHMLGTIGVVAGAIAGFVPATIAAIVTGISGGAYAISRGLSKMGKQ